MDNYDKIFTIASHNNGYVRTSDLAKENVDRKFMSNLVKDGLFSKRGRGLYSIEPNPYDEFYEVQCVNDNVRFSLNTALYFNDLSDRTPILLDVSVPYNYSGSLLKDKRVKVNFIDPNVLDLGIKDIKSPCGNDIVIYDKERCICDIIKYKNKVDPEVFSKALKEYVGSKSKNLINLTKYSKMLNVDKKVNEYMRILL